MNVQLRSHDSLMQTEQPFPCERCSNTDFHIHVSQRNAREAQIYVDTDMAYKLEKLLKKLSHTRTRCQACMSSLMPILSVIHAFSTRFKTRNSDSFAHNVHEEACPLRAMYFLWSCTSIWAVFTLCVSVCVSKNVEKP
jgi:hypothetical protein